VESTNKILCTFILISLTACGPDSNTAPDLLDPGVLSLEEGQTSIVKLTANDADNDPITFSISAGLDKDLFTLDSSTGDLAFIEAPDFEQPKDSGKDNQYQLTVTASDGKSTRSSDSIDLTLQVTDALEGRVVDGPLAGSTIFVDLNENGTQDDNEPTGVTDAEGFFSIDQLDATGKLIAKGGTDNATGVALPEFVLVADIPEERSVSLSITPITTLLAQVSSSEEKQALLSKLGLDESYLSVIATDYWAMAQDGNQAAMKAQRINQHIGLLMQTASSLKVDSADSSPSLIIANSLVKQNELSFSRAENIYSILENASTNLSLSLTKAQLAAVANSVAMINAAIASPDLNPTDGTAREITLVAQQKLQINITALVEGEITADKFSSENNSGSLFSDITVPEDAIDTDNDNLANIIDPDDDNDGVLDINDAFPLDSSESMDTDGDGIGNNADPDDDNDGIADSDDAFPLDSSESLDTDGDGIGNNADPDDDNDGVLDINDAFPLDSSESMDTDGDGIGNNADPDDDNDGIADSDDAFPLDSSESLDTDGDGIGNNADPDDDNDGVADSRDPSPLNGDITPPTAVISADKQSGPTPLVVNFDASNSIAGNDQNNILSYLWDFADGVQEPYRKTQRVYSSAGTYPVQLTVKNNDGFQHTMNISIEVSSGQASYSVSGKVSVADNTDVDSDINDQRSTIVPNGNFDDFINSAQIIDSIPMQLTGYVNVPGEGHEGPLKQEGDFSDIFKFDALGNEVIILDIPHTSADNNSSVKPLLDLYLYNEIGELIDFSWNFGDTQLVINAPNAQGTYFVEVNIFYHPEFIDVKSSSDYKLTFDYSNTSIQATNTNVTKAADFVIGDIIVKRKSNCNSKQVNDLISSKTIRPLQQKGSKTGPALYSYGDRIIKLSKSFAGNKPSTRFSKSQSRPTEVELKAATLLVAREIAHLPCVEYAEPNYRRYKSLTPNDSQYNQQWHYEKINLPDAWDTTIGNEAIKVAVLDTGIALTHPDLIAKHSDDGYDFVSAIYDSGDGDGIDGNPTDSCYNSHGTHVAGTVGATTDNSLGVAGVDWKAKIMSVRVLGCIGGTDYDIAQGIRYAAGLGNDSGIIVSDPADIINMSLGGAGYNQTLADSIVDAVNSGVIVIAAAGNESTSMPSYPAANEGVISVAATNSNNEQAYFSNFGPTIDVAAPGVDILSTVVKFADNQINHNYEAYNGTSMAAPHIAGVTSLMKAVYSSMIPDDFEAILMSGNITDDLGDSGRDDYFGYGLINAKKAVEYAKQIGDGSILVPVTPILGINQSHLNFGLVSTAAVIRASNIGSKNSTVTITDIEVADTFVSVTKPDSSDGLGNYTIRINRTDLSPGIYNSSIKFLSNGGEKTLSILFKVLDPNQRFYGNAGNIYLHLTNTDTGEVTKINVLEPVNGEYAFKFPHVAAGKYNLRAGNDLDNNGVLCQGAEGCGYYGGNAETPLEINADTTGIDFNLDY
jgi:serine protease